MSKAINKTVLTHPQSGREVKIDTTIYTPFSKAILKSLKGTSGKSFTDLADDVEKKIRKELPFFKGSIPWYTISILRDLETKGLVESVTIKGKKLNRLKK